MRAELKIAVITRTSARPSHPDGSGSFAFLDAARKIHQLGSELIALRVAPLACLAVGQSHAGKRAAFSAAHPPADRAGAVRGMGLLAFDIDWNTGILQGILFACVPSLFSVALLVAISQEVCTESYSDFGDANEKARQSRRSTQGIALELCKRGVHVAAVVSAT